MRKEYNSPSIGFTAFRNKNRTNMEYYTSDPVGLGSPNMDEYSYKVRQLPKS